MTAPRYAEIEIRKVIASATLDGLTYQGDDPRWAGCLRYLGKTYGSRAEAEAELVPAGDILAAIEAARASAVRALLVTIDSRGGGVDGSLAIYEALRRFSDDCGIVVVYIAGKADSTASVIACAGDYVLAHPEAWIGIHSAAGPTPAAAAQSNERFLAVYVERTGMTREALEEALAPPPDVVTGIPADAAAALGWADFMGDEAEAHRFVDSIAKGWRPAGPRRDMLAARAARGWPAATLEATGLTNFPGAAYQGSWCRVVTAPSTAQVTLTVTPLIPIAEGETVYAEAMVAPEATATNNGTTLLCGRMVLEFVNAAGTGIAWAYKDPTASGSYQKLSFSAAAPAGSSTMRLRFEVNGQAKKAYIDNMVLRKGTRYEQQSFLKAYYGVPAAYQNAFTVTFATAEPSTGYTVLVTYDSCLGGTPVSAAKVVESVAKSTTGFTVTLVSADPSGLQPVFSCLAVGLRNGG